MATPLELSSKARRTLSEGAPSTDVDDAFRGAVLASPMDVLLLAEWNDTLRARYSPTEICTLFGAIQSDVERPIRSVLLALRDLCGREGIGTYCSNFEELRQSEGLSLIEGAWSQLSEGHISDEDGYTARIRRVPHELFELYFAVFAPPIEVLNAGSGPDMRTLTTLGYNHDAIGRLASELSDANVDMLSIVESHTPEPWRLDKIISMEMRGHYKYRVLSDGNLVVTDPWNGLPVSAIDSVRIFGRTIYTFSGTKLFFLICGRQGNDALGLFIPSEFRAIGFDASTKGQLSTQLLANVNAALLKRALKLCDAFNQAFSETENVLTKKVIVHIEKTENFAHHLWNFYSSLDHMLQLGLEKHISRVVFSGTRFFGELGSFFPEVSERVERPVRNNVVDPCPFSRTEILVGAGSNFMAKTLPERMISAAKRSDPSFAAKVQRVAEDAYPIIWIGMRLKDKAWISQAEGIPIVINAVLASYPNAVFLLDGFSLPMMDQANISQWGSYKDTLKAISESILTRVGDPGRVIDLVGNTMDQSVLWASVVDAYLAPLGTSQHKVGWFSDAPGVVYTSPTFEGKALTTPGAWAAGISPTPEFVTGIAAGAGERRGVSRTREQFENVELDIDDIVRRLMMLLAENGKSNVRRGAY